MKPDDVPFALDTRTHECEDVASTVGARRRTVVARERRRDVASDVVVDDMRADDGEEVRRARRERAWRPRAVQAWNVSRDEKRASRRVRRRRHV